MTKVHKCISLAELLNFLNLKQRIGQQRIQESGKECKAL